MPDLSHLDKMPDPDWYDMLDALLDVDEGLSPSSLDFINGLDQSRRSTTPILSQRQRAWLEDLYNEHC